jgi:hypothetical protein
MVLDVGTFDFPERASRHQRRLVNGCCIDRLNPQPKVPVPVSILNAPWERVSASRRYTEKIAFPINEVSAAAQPA